MIYSYNAVPTKIAIAFFNVEIQKIFSTGELHVKPRMRSQAANTVMNKNKTGGILKYKVTVIKRVWYLRTNGGKVNWCIMENNMEVPSPKLNIELAYDPIICRMSIHSKEIKSIPKRDMHSMFIAILFIVAKLQKQLKCPLINEKIKKMWQIYSMGYF